MKRNLLLFVPALFLFTHAAWAQLPPNQPEQDCPNAIPVCQNVYNQPNSYQGEGLNGNEINGGSSCLTGGEVNDAWYIFTVTAPGDLNFLITPLAAFDDYDWAVYDITTGGCAGIATGASPEVSCNFSGTAGPTGANLPGAPASQGAGGTPLNGPIPAMVGQTFVLNVSNWSGTGSGYMLDFTASTATIFDNVPPQLDTVFVPCGTTDLTAGFSENVLCNSVDPADFTVTGPGGPFTVTAVSGINCAAGGTFEDNYVLTVTPPIGQPGLYTISMVGNYVDNCGNVGLLNSANETLNPQSLNLTITPNPVCAGSQAVITTSVSQLPGHTFSWNPGGATSPTLTVTPTMNSTYVVTVTDPTGCVSTGTGTIMVANSVSSTFSVSPQQICGNQSATITYTGSATPAGTYLWDFDGGIAVPGTGPGPHTITWPANGPKSVTLSVSENGCVSPQSVQPVVVADLPTSDFSGPSTLCVGESGMFTYTGNAPASGAYSWNFDGGIITNGTGQGPYLVQWATPGIKNVCMNVDLGGCTSQIACMTLNVKDKPFVSIDANADQCLMGNSFDFTYSGSTGIDAFFWNFGADAFPPVSSSPNPTNIVYSNEGVKTVSLWVVKDGCVSDTVTASFEVVPEPTADFQVNTGAICAGECLNFTYTGNPAYVGQTYSWNFGNFGVPQSSSLQNPGCVLFTVGGYHNVSLIVNYKGCTDVKVIQVQVYDRPQVDAGPDMDFCEGDGGTPLDGSAAGGDPPYTYQWWCNVPACGLSDPYTEDPMANPTDTTVYYFQVTDANGCKSNIDSTTVNVKPKPIADAGPDKTICEEGFGVFLAGSLAATNTAPGPFSYQWSPCDGMLPSNCVLPNPYVRPDSSTIYTLVITDQSTGCTSEVNTLDTLSTTTVHVNPLPIAEAGPDTSICLDETIQLQGFGYHAGPDYTYSWTPNDASTGISNANIATPTVSPDFTTTFFLVVGSNGCLSEADSMVVEVHTLPTTNAGPRKDICLGDSVLLNGLAAGDPTGTAYEYEWMPANGLSDPYSAMPMASPDTTTVYYLQAGTAKCFGFVDTIEVEVKSTAVVQALSRDTVICLGDSIPLYSTHSFTTTPMQGPIVYEWFPQTHISDIHDPNPTVWPDVSTIFTVQVSIAGECPTTDEIRVEVTPTVDADLVADTNVICSGDGTWLHALGGVGDPTYTWSPTYGLSDSTIAEPYASPDVTTIYTVEIQEGKCAGMASLELTVHPSPEVEYLVSHTEGCVDLEVSFLETTANGTSFIWDFGDGTIITNENNPSHTYTAAGLYPVTLTSVGTGGCRRVGDTTWIEVYDNTFADFMSLPSAGEDIQLPNGRVDFTDLSPNAISWLWDFGNGVTSVTQHPDITYQTPGEYTVSLTVTNEQGCASTVLYGPYRVVEPELLIPNVMTPNGDGINDEFEVIYTGTETFRLQVYDRWGKRYFESDAPTERWTGMNKGGSDAREGVYFYSLRIGEKEYNGNVTLMR